MRVKIRVTGIVQGVGFRPFIYRTADKNHLNGYVRNRGDAGVEIVLEG
ncbi:MAG: acylphosphatase, partial [Nitrososphaeria archaeon]